MQSVLSRNWTRITVSISCDDNHYTTATSYIVTWYATERESGVNSPTLLCLNQQAKATCTPWPIISWTEKGMPVILVARPEEIEEEEKGQMIGQTL